MAEKLCRALEAEGYSIWWDRQIPGGAEFSKDIEKELQSARAVVVIWSKHSVQSRWVRDEAGFAADAGKLIPIVVDETQKPMGFKQFQFIDFAHWNGAVDAPAFLEMSRALKAKLTGAVDAPPSSFESAPAPRRPVTTLLIAAALAVGVLAAGLGFYQWMGRPAPVQESAGPAPQTNDGPQQASSENAIAVLPFDDFSPQGDQEYFADGISEELLNVLSRIEGLRVISRTSAFAFKGREASVGEIADALQVSHVLEGSVRKAGGAMRITAQLIDARADRHLWSATYDRPLTAENIFAIQDEISQSIVQELQGRIAPSADAAAQTASTDAYDAYLRGRALTAKRTVDDITNGIAELNRAVTLDPDFAPVHSALVEAYIYAASYAGLSFDQAHVLAGPHVERAMALAPDAPQSLAAKGRSLAVFEGDNVAAIDFYERAIAANPNFSDAHRFLGLAFSSLLRADLAKKEFEIARRLDPLSSVILANLFRTNWDLGDVDAMIFLAQENMRLYPDSIFGRMTLGDLLREQGDYAGAHRLYKDNEAQTGITRSQLADLYADIGRDDLAAPRAGWRLQAVRLLREGDRRRAAALAHNGSPPEGVAILRWAGEREAAYAMIVQDIARRDLLSAQTQITARDQAFDIYYADILRGHDDPAADIYRARLADHFGGRAPADFQLRESHYAGAMWRMMNDDPEGALRWLDAFIAAGHVMPEMALEPLFDSLRSTAAFAALDDRMADNAARYRRAIEAQLADPEPGWVSP